MVRRPTLSRLNRAGSRDFMSGTVQRQPQIIDDVSRRGPDPSFKSRALFLVPFFLLGLAVLFLPWPFRPEPTTRHFTLDSRQFEYQPGTLAVNRGDTVVLTITASDVVHGLYLDAYGLDVRVEPGQSETIRFVADKPGKFRYRCSVSCGPLHPFMIGELIVGPNTAFGRAVSLALLTTAGALVYLWRFPPREPGEV